MRRLLILLAIVAALCGAGPASAAVPTIYITNPDGAIPDAVVADAVPVWQRGISEDLARYWNADAHLVYIGAAEPPAGEQWISLEDYSPYWNALAYHDIDENGTPFGRVFVRTCWQYEANWEVAFDHELQEMLVDPQINRAVQVGSRFYLLEVSDPVEDDRYAYWRASPSGAPVALSDFVTPNWYRPLSEGPYDFLGFVKRPLQLLPGGYAAYWHGGRWTIVDRFSGSRHAE